MSKLTVRCRILDAEEPRELFMQGQQAKCLLALVEAGERGVTAQEVAGWAYRLAGYVHFLARKHGVHCAMEREPHAGGWHGRYRLRTPVRVLEIIEPNELGRAA